MFARLLYNTDRKSGQFWFILVTRQYLTTERHSHPSWPRSTHSTHSQFNSCQKHIICTLKYFILTRHSHIRADPGSKLTESLTVFIFIITFELFGLSYMLNLQYYYVTSWKPSTCHSLFLFRERVEDEERASMCAVLKR